jgi:cysteine desulfurase family protein
MQNTSAAKNREVIYLDNAATSWPKPESVYLAMDDFIRTRAGNPGRGSHSMALAAKDTVDETRMLVARLINAKEINRVIFTLNCTDALNMGLKGLLKPGDHVITDCISHNSVMRPLVKLEQQGIKFIGIRPSSGSDYPSLRDIADAINSNTKLIVLNHASNVTGVIQPVAEYGKLARQHNLLLLVDAAQTAGVFPIDIQEYNIDLLAFSGHKGLFGPTGTGCLYIGDRVELDPFREGGTGSYSEMLEQPETFPDKYESGTLNSIGICGLGAGIKYILGATIEKIQQHERGLSAFLIEGLSQIPGIRVYAARKIKDQAPVFSCNIAGYEPGEAGNILDQSFNIKVRTGLHCAPLAHKTFSTFPSGTIRLSPGYFNTVDDINETIAAFTRIAVARKADPTGTK